LFRRRNNSRLANSQKSAIIAYEKDRSRKEYKLMDQNESAALYAELCNVVDKELCKISGFVIADDIPSTSPQARECVNRIIDVLAKYGIVLPE
jgi:hypothetical protein